MPELSPLLDNPGEAGWQNSLLATKLYIPLPRSRFVSRPRLIQHLNAGIQEKLTCICAPAGFGKSSLLSEWCAWQGEQTEQAPLIAWVSLDSGDNDPARFCSYILAAIERVYPGVGGSARSLLMSRDPPAMQVILTTLINTLLTVSGKIILILDDYHLITNSSIHESLAFLLDHLPPQLHLVIASRAEPPLMLSRLRSRGQLTEVRTDDLRFTLAETVAFLHLATGLAYPEEAVTLLEERTEGWVAGLHLAALSLKGRTDSRAFLAAFAGSHRYILDYLSEEVLSQQREAVQRFLLHTSVLERLSGPLCDAVTGQRQSQAILEQLEQVNLFIVPLDDERVWYRYHHLLSDVLRRQLQHSQPELIADLHRRAAGWYEQQGLLSEAISHTLAASDFEWAARLMEQAATPMLMRGEWNTFSQWLQSLPSQVLAHHPRLCIGIAWLYTSSSVHLEAVEPYLHMAEAYLAEKPEDLSLNQVQEMRGEIDGIRAILIHRQGDLARAIPLFEQALENIPGTHVFQRALICLHLGASQVFSGKVVLAQSILQEAVRLSQEAKSLYSLMHAFHRLNWVQRKQGQLRRAYATCQRGFQLINAFTGQEDSMHARVMYIGMGNILREWNELERAAQVLVKGIEGCEQIGESFHAAIGYQYLARVRLAQGVPDEAQALLEAEKEVLQHRQTTIPFRYTISEYQVYIWLAQGKLERVIEWARAQREERESTSGYLETWNDLVLVRVLLAQTRAGKFREDEHPLDEALQLIEEICQTAGTDGRVIDVIEAMNLQALVLSEQGNLTGALVVLQRAVEQAEPQGYMRLFVDEGPPMAVLLRRLRANGIAPDYLTMVLEGFESVEPDQGTDLPKQSWQTELNRASRSKTLPTLLEPLSSRELEVLELIAEGRSNEEIGRELYVSVGTVKTHLKHIYGKLEVHTRTQAVARARELHLLSPDR